MSTRAATSIPWACCSTNLLTGSTPLEAEQLREAGYAEIQRLIKESEPLKPSTRLSTSGEKLTAIAKHRSVSPDRLSALIRGDLDWVVMKALEKDRNRRYATPVELGDDVTRYLSKEPVEAYPPSTAYRMRKFVRRNRSLVLGASALAIVLLSATLIAVKSEKETRRTLRQLKDSLEREAVDLVATGDDDFDAAVARARKAVRTDLWASRMQAIAAIFSGDLNEAERLLVECYQRGDDSAAIHALSFQSFTLSVENSTHVSIQFARRLRGR